MWRHFDALASLRKTNRNPLPVNRSPVRDWNSGELSSTSPNVRRYFNKARLVIAPTTEALIFPHTIIITDFVEAACLPAQTALHRPHLGDQPRAGS